MKVGIVGTGYVGLTTGACLAFIGHDVVCVDSDLAKVDGLRAGKVPIHEPHLAELLGMVGVHMRFTSDYGTAIADADVVFIAVNTPSAEDGSPDLRYLQAAAEGIGQHLAKAHTVVVNKSTVPIGSANWVESILRESFERTQGSADATFAVASNPEFLREGSAIFDSLYPDRVVIGSDDEHSREVLYHLYRPVLDQSFTPPPFVPRPEGLGAVPLVACDLASAELIKYAANAFLALKISYANEISLLAGKVGADIGQVTKGIGLDSRIGSRFLQPGIGWGGSCFGKDTAALVATAADYSLEMPLVTAARAINRRQRDLVVDRLQDELRILKGRTVGLLGLAFKPNTDDLRDAPAVEIADRLLQRGARVRLHDPVAMNRLGVERPDLAPFLRETAVDAARGCDALVLATEWTEYLEADWTAIGSVMRTPVLLDGRTVLDPDRIRAAGLRMLSLSGWLPA